MRRQKHEAKTGRQFEQVITIHAYHIMVSYLSNDLMTSNSSWLSSVCYMMKISFHCGLFLMVFN